MFSHYYFSFKPQLKILSFVSIFVVTAAVAGSLFFFHFPFAHAEHGETLFFDDFVREDHPSGLNHDENFEISNDWEEFEPDGDPEDARLIGVSGKDHYARLRKEASITQEIPSWSDDGFAYLSFLWRGDKDADGEELRILVNGDDLMSLDLSAGCETESGSPCDWQGVEDFLIPQDYEVCDSGAELTFETTAIHGNVTVALDDVRVACVSGTISGYKWNDLDGNGERDEGEELLNGWTINLSSGESVITGDGDWPDGYYEFTGLEPWQNYTACEKLEPGWVQTFPEDEVCGDSDEGPFGHDVWLGEDPLVENLNFGNRKLPSIHAFKFYDLNQNGEHDWEDLNENGSWDWGEGEMPVVGWEICLWSEYDVSISPDNCQLTDENGFVWWDVTPGALYWMEEDDDWEITTPPDGTIFVDVDGDGNITYWYRFLDPECDCWNQRFVDRAEFGNFTEPGAIHAVKYLSLFGDELEGGNLYEEVQGGLLPGLVGWEICLSRGFESWDEENEEWAWEWVAIDCEETNEDGWVWWMDLPPGYYQVEEHTDDGWLPLTETVWQGWLESGQTIEDIWFVNQDIGSPVSHFLDPLNHEVINTEIVSLELQGTSVDNFAITPDRGRVELRAHQLAGEFFVDSFFDVFTELEFSGPPRIFGEIGISCDDTVVERNPIPPELGGNEVIPIELVALSLQSVDPIQVQWSGNWEHRLGPGVYCFEAFATDDAGNTERTAWAGPLAYVPGPQISQESSSVGEIVNDVITIIIQWLTSHPATSRVIYDTVSHPVLDDPPDYGYAFSTVEDPTLVTEHSVTLSDLLQGTTYYYRTVSHGSPENVGGEQTFSTPSPPSPPPSFSTLPPEPATSTPPTESQAETSSPSEESGEATTQIPPATPGEALPPQPPAENQGASGGESQSSTPPPAGAPTTSSLPATPGKSSGGEDAGESVAFGSEGAVLPESTPGGVIVTPEEPTATSLPPNSLLASLVSILTPVQWLGVGALAALASLGGRKVWMKRGVKPSKPKKKP